MDVKADVTVDKKTYGIQPTVPRKMIGSALKIAADFHRRIDAVGHLMVSVGFENARNTEIISRFKTTLPFPDDSFRADEIISRDDLFERRQTIEDRLWDQVCWAFDVDRRFMDME
jgi:hypothetical protein